MVDRVLHVNYLSGNQELNYRYLYAIRTCTWTCICTLSDISSHFIPASTIYISTATFHYA